MKLNTRKRRGLLVLLFVLVSIVALLVYMFFSNPVIDETFNLSSSAEAARKLNLTMGKHVSVWFTVLPPGMSGRSAQDWIIWFYVTDPSNSTILSDSGIVSTGWFYPPTFVAQQEGTYTMHFSNTVGGSFDRTVRLSYRITQSIFGVPFEYLLLFMLIAAMVPTLIVAARVFKEKNKANQGNQ